MKRYLSLLLICCLALISQAQVNVPWFGNITWVNGFAREISGENLSYFSAYPDYATTSLLTRATDGKKVIEWETAPVPENGTGPYVYFSWVAAHSSGTSKGERNFDLYLNGEKLLTFTTYPAHQHPDWKFTAPDSSALVFQQTKRDGANDAHGLAYLRLPMSRVKPGQPCKLKVVGHAQNSPDWYMTFKFSFEEKVDVTPMPFILKNNRQPVVLTALHFGKEKPINVLVDNTEAYTFMVQNGMNNFDIPVEIVKHRDSVLIKVSVGDQVLVNKNVEIQQVVYRELNLIHHSHTDIGYSHLQPDVLKIHLKNIDDALAMIEATKNYPAEARFKWNVESLWAVDNYMKQASAPQKAKFIAAVKAGSICLSALYANILTGLSEPEETFHFTDYALQLNKEYGLKLNSAMISDIPGYAWTTVSALAKGGVRYFSSGPNYMGETHPFMGDRVGHFVREWADKPVWWVSPSGEERVLFWTAGKGYSSWHGTAPGGEFDRGAKKIAAYLNELYQKKYPYELVQWRYNIVADNGPIDTTISRFVKEWNEKYNSPKLVLNTTEKLFEEFEKRYGNKIPEVKGDITPYWEDGALSTADEEGRNRQNSLKLQQLTTLYSIINPTKYKKQQFYDAWTNIIMFHEHTWGAYNSISEPDVPFVKEQWRIKKLYAENAEKQVKAIGKELYQPLTVPASKTIEVFNSTSWKRSGLVTFSSAAKGNSVKDANGKLHPLQKLKNGDYAFMANDVPPLGSAIFQITNEVTPLSLSFNVSCDSEWTNSLITMGWEKTNGTVSIIRDKDNFNYVGTYKNQGLNSYWYVPGMNPEEAKTNNKVKVELIEEGRVISTFRMSSDAPGLTKFERRVSLVADRPEVMIEDILTKNEVRTKEGIHFGFPFNPAFTKTTLDAGYGAMNYMDGMLKGSNADYIYGRRWMDVSGDHKGMQLMFLETPLLEPSNMIDERLSVNQSLKQWKKERKPTNMWFSYCMDNYWHTNYKIDQGGTAHFKYCLRPHGEENPVEMEKAAEEFTQPMIALPVKENTMAQESLFELTNNNIVVTNVEPLPDGSMVIRLFNPGKVSESTGFVWKSFPAEWVVNKATGTILGKGITISIPPLGVNEYIIKK